MKVLHVPYCFRPDTVGGTEVYVEALAREQQRRGLEVAVAAPGPTTSDYRLDGLAVRRFATATDATVSVLYGAGDPVASAAFARVVHDERPDVVHLHAFTSAVSVLTAHAARQQGARLVFTYHTPTVSCQRGTLLRWGRQVCDGRLRARTCSACGLHGAGVLWPASLALAGVPARVGIGLGRLGLAGGAWTGLRMTDLVQQRHAAVRRFLQQMDHVVVVCGWAGDLLLGNGVPAEKLTLSRHGLPPRPAGGVARPAGPGARRDALRVAYVGRLDPTKGVDVLVRAVRALPSADVELHVFGLVQGAAATAYQRSIRALAADDRRIQFGAPVPSDAVPALLAGYDVLAVPSRWLETGPLVVLEAFQAGVPVVGSRVGGIGELVHDGEDGLLVTPGSAADWSAALRRLAGDPQLVQRLRRGVRPPRSIAAVADDMDTVYHRALNAGSRTLADAPPR